MVSVSLSSDALLQHLPSYLGFSYLGRGVSLHGCSSKAQLLLLTMDEGYLLTAAPPDLECGVAPLGPPAHYVYYCGQESLRRNGVAIMVKKRVQNAVLGCNLRNDRIFSVRFQGKLFNIMVIQAYAPNSNAEEAEVEQLYVDLQDLFEVTPKKDIPFHSLLEKCKSKPQ